MGTDKPYRLDSLGSPHYHVLCRELKHVEEVLALGVRSIVGDFAELHRCGHAVRMAREQGAEIYLATPRIQKPGEEDHFAGSPTPSPTASWSATWAGRPSAPSGRFPSWPICR